MKTCQPHRAGGSTLWSRTAVAFLAWAVTWCTIAPAMAMYPKVQFEELVHSADVIFVGRVQGISSRLLDENKAIVTDVTFEVLDRVHVAARSAPVGAELVLTYVGGDAGGVGMTICDMPQFEVGGEYLLFARNDGQLYANPMVAGPQGLFKIWRDETTGEAYPIASGWMGIADVVEGKAQLTDPIKRIKGGVIEFEPVHGLAPAPVGAQPGDAAATAQRGGAQPLTMEQVKVRVQEQLTLPLVEPLKLRLNEADVQHHRPEMGKVPANPLARIKEAVDAGELLVPVAEKVERFDLMEESDRLATNVRPLGEPGDEPLEELQELNDRATLCGCGYFDLFLVMEQVPTTWWEWGFHNNTMAHFNEFMDIYRYVADDGSFGNNNENEFCGYVNNATLNSVYGFNWGGALAITITWFPSGCPCCELSQADVMFNTAFSWTNDFNVALDGTPINYQPVLIHELGHTWGLQRGSCTEDYSYSRPTIMHAYYSNIIEDGFGLHSWDSFAIRDLYDNQTSVLYRSDVGIESYAPVSGSLSNAFTNTSTYLPGQSITVSRISVENMSTFTQSDVRIRMYLSSNTVISTGDYLMGSYWSFASFGSNSWWNGNLTTTVPNVPPGMYYVGLMVTINGASYTLDSYSPNNTSRLKNRIEVRAPAPSNNFSYDAIPIGPGSTGFTTLGATTDGRTHVDTCPHSTGQAYNDIWYTYTPTCDGSITLSTCNLAQYDTVLVLYRDDGFYPPFSSAVIACNDDYAGCSNNTSFLTANVVGGTTYLIRVGGYFTSSAGPGTLALGFTLTGPSNNACATPITVTNGDLSFDTTCASTDGLANGSCQFDGQIYNDLWYRYVATCTGTLTISTCDQALYDTDLAIYTGSGSCPPAANRLLACNDDFPGCGIYTSQISIPVTQGTAYLIRVGGYVSSSRGPGTLTISCAAPLCLGDANRDGVVSFPDITSILFHYGTTYPGTGLGDSNQDSTVSFPDITSTLFYWGAICQ